MIGSVEIAAAQPGDVVECPILTLRTINGGWNSFPLGVGALPHDFDQPYVHYFRFDDARTVAEFADGVTIALRPLVTNPERSRHHRMTAAERRAE